MFKNPAEKLRLFVIVMNVVIGISFALLLIINYANPQLMEITGGYFYDHQTTTTSWGSIHYTESLSMTGMFQWIIFVIVLPALSLLGMYVTTLFELLMLDFFKDIHEIRKNTER